MIELLISKGAYIKSERDCGQILPCGHPCQGTRNECSLNHKHSVCKITYTKKYPCGHEKTDLCFKIPKTCNKPECIKNLQEFRQNNTKEVVEFLHQCPFISNIIYPGISDESCMNNHIPNDLLICFDINNGFNYRDHLIKNLTIPQFATEINKFGSFIQHPRTQSIQPSPNEKRINNNTFRICIGDESSISIIDSLKNAFSQIFS